ncbi:MAG: hypothetical protein AB1509_16450, partial [Chloroflexota bacterium]
FAASIAWDRKFLDGTTAPIGEYEVIVKASDLAGNESRETAHIIISAPGVTPAPLPTRRVEPVETRIPQPQTTDNCPLMTDDCSLPAPAAAPQSSFILSPTRAAVVSAFQSSARQSPNLQSNNLQSNNRQSPAPLFDAAALAAIAAATAYALEQRRKRKDEEARQRAEAQREAARRNAAEEARKAQAYLLAQIAAQQAAQEQSSSHRGEEAKIERMEEAEGAVLAAAKAAKPQRGEQAYQDYRAGERDAETIVADYQTRKAVQEYRQGEREEYVTPVATLGPKKPWWQRANDWIQDKVDRFVQHPFSWMSVSYQGPFDSKNLFVDEIIYPQFSVRNGFETWVYQSVSVSVETTTKFTSNPSGWLDFNFSNGRLTFKGNEKSNGSRIDYFIQPFALSVGQIASTPTKDDPRVKIVNVSTIDVDILGKDWASLKVSQASGLSTAKTNTLPTGETIAISENFQLKGTVSIHRWPRIVAIAGAFVYVWEAAGGGAALETLASTPLVQQAIQAIP